MLQRTLTFAMALTLAVASAQAQNAQRERSATPGGAGQAGATNGQQGQQLDQPIATCLLLGNLEEIALAEFAQGRLQNEQAKEFAQTMIRDHQQAVQKLEKIAPELAGLNLQLAATDGQGAPGQRNQPGRAGEAASQFGTPGEGAATGQAGQQGQPGQTAQRGQTAGGSQSPMVALQKQIAQECLQLTEQELSQLEGPEFDIAYMSQQMGAHIGMLAKLRASEKFASNELRQLITELTGTVEHHKEMAKQIKTSLKSESGAPPRQAAQGRPAQRTQ